MARASSFCFVALTFVIGAGVTGNDLLFAQKGRRAPSTEWVEYAGDSDGSKYSPLSQINKDNVKNLKVAWRWASADRDVQKSNVLNRASRYEDTPLMVNGTLYTGTPLGMVAALDAGTGKQKWVYDPESYKAGKPHSVGFVVRGLSYWTDGKVERILHSTSDAYLISIDATTGKPDPAFGMGGKVDLTTGFQHALRSRNFTGRRALVAGDVLVVGNAIQDATAGKEDESPRGYVKAYDVRTGKELWTFHTIPLPGEVGYETWLEGSAERTGNANAWAGMVYDADLDYAYIATSAPGSDYYGALRPGDNLFSDSLICVEAKTGKRVWHFQGIHHDLWDYDITMHPTLVEIRVNGRMVKAVVGISKNGMIFVLNRKTGEPIWPIVETPVPQANTSNRERTSPTQPIPSKPLPPETQGALPETMMDFTPELKRRALEQLKAFEAGPIYTPPTVKGTLKVPGSLGGPNWGGAAFDPETGTLFVPTRMTMDLLRARFTDATPGSAPNIPGQAAKMYVDDLPIIKAPYSRVTAIDLNTGDHAWMTPLGNGPRNHPLLKNLNLPPLGDSVLGGAPLVTKSLLFVGVTYTFVTGRALPPPWAKWNDPGFTRKLVYVFDKASGAIVHVLEGDSLSTAAPMTYAHKGKQFLVVASGNGEDSALVAYSLNGVKAE